MEFSLFLSNYYPDTRYPAARLFDDMLEQARWAEALGFCAVTIPEHHFMNILRGARRGGTGSLQRFAEDDMPHFPSEKESGKAT